MRNSASRHNFIRCLAALPAAIVPFIVMLAPASAAEPFRIGSEDLVALRADTAWEDTTPDTVHFSGRFEMQVRDWRLAAERATVKGRLEDPQRVELEGSPARLIVLRSGTDAAEPVQATARRIIYDRDRSVVELEGDARIAQGDSVLRSDHFEYDPVTDRLSAVGRTRVRIDIAD